MPPKLELSGRRFGKLLVENEHGRDLHGAVMWLCVCDCGSSSVVRGTGLIAGRTRSCGCGMSEAARRPKTHGASKTALYRRWRAMLDRVQNPNHGEFGNYGGRGIQVCDRWHSFIAFRADMGNTFQEELTLERVDVNGNYEPANCRWATSREQNINRRNNHKVTFQGQTMTVQEWGEKLGIKPNTIVTRLRRGWPIERALRIANEATRD